MVPPLGGEDGRENGIRPTQPMVDYPTPAQGHEGFTRPTGTENGSNPADTNLTPSTSSQPAASLVTPPPENELRRRQAVAVSTDVDLIIEDGSGSTIAEATLRGIPTAPTDITLPIGVLTVPALVNTPPVISLPINDLNTNSAPSPAPTPSLSIQVPGASSQVVISSPPTPAPSDSTFSSFPLSTPSPSIATSNSTTAAPSLGSTSSFTAQIVNSTTTTRSSTTPSTLATSTSSLSPSSSRSSITSTPSAQSASSIASATGATGGFGIGGGTATSAAPSATSSTAAAAASGGTPTYVPVVGGVLGGLAGLALLLVAALFFLRWYKRRERAAGRLQDDDESVPPDTSHSNAPMAENSAAPWGAALAPLMRRMRPHSTTTAATSETGPSERGFQKISGRKIESVLVSGGDGYGSRGPGAGNLSGQSFYRDSYGTYGGGESQHSSMVVGPASPRKSAANSDFTDISGKAGPSNVGRSSEKEVVTMRPGPARQPVTSPAYTVGGQPPGSQVAPPPPPPPAGRDYSPASVQRLRTPDPLGRSRPSHDGSRGSKFAEDLK